MSPEILLLAFVFVAAAVVLGVIWSRIAAAGAARSRLFDETPEGPVDVAERFERAGPLARWLTKAGFTRRSAPAVFVTATVACVATGATAATLFVLLDLPALLVSGLAPLGVVGDVFIPAAVLAPWISLLVFGLIPYVVVSASRRERVTLIEQDLPTALELMATLGESGLAFDTAVGRIIETRLGTRPLATELRRYQSDMLAGRPRTDALRRLARRVDVAGVSIVVSALVHADQLGMGIADVLRRQADDLRSRRRERANAFAMSLSVKLLFPLVICFLPGIFLWTLGPVFIQLFQISDSLLGPQQLL